MIDHYQLCPAHSTVIGTKDSIKLLCNQSSYYRKLIKIYLLKLAFQTSISKSATGCLNLYRNYTSCSAHCKQLNASTYISLRSLHTGDFTRNQCISMNYIYIHALHFQPKERVHYAYRNMPKCTALAEANI